jgi:hypothetical protein
MSLSLSFQSEKKGEFSNLIGRQPFSEKNAPVVKSFSFW